MAPRLFDRIRKRRRTRGAAATEAAVTAVFFVFIFACMWGAVTYHVEKLRVMKEARADGWNYALNSCSGSEGTTVSGGDFMSGIDGEGAPAAGVNGTNAQPANSQDIPQFQDSALNDDMGYAVVEGTGAVTMPGLIGGTSYAPKSKFYVRCNEDPPPTSLGDLASTAWGLIWPPP